VKVVAVNVRSGGTRSTIEPLLLKCVSHDPDIIVLCEYRDNPIGELAREFLGGRAFAYQSNPQGFRGNGVLIAAKRPFRALNNPFGLPHDEYPNAITEAVFPDMRLFGAYLPGQDRKRPHLRCLIATAEHFNQLGISAMCIGDFNSGRNTTDIERNLGKRRLVDTFSTADLYAELELHWTEAWLHLHRDPPEFSWYPFRHAAQMPHRNGWRIDKAFVSNALLGRLISAEYDHTFRTEKLTDHSALVVETRYP
jgi:exodeoxyribonuclease III